MDITTNFKIGAAVWDGDKFLLESATPDGNKQMKVTAEVVRAYLGGKAGTGAGDLRVLPFAGIVDDMEVIAQSVLPGALGLDIYFVRTQGRFAAVQRRAVEYSQKTGSLNWGGRELYEDDMLTPRQGNLYVCDADDKAYWWNGVTLRQIASAETGVVQGESLSGDEIDAAVSGVALASPASSSPAKAQAVVADSSDAGSPSEASPSSAGNSAEVTLVARAAEVTTAAPMATVTTISRAAEIDTV